MRPQAERAKREEAESATPEAEQITTRDRQAWKILFQDECLAAATADHSGKQPRTINQPARKVNDFIPIERRFRFESVCAKPAQRSRRSTMLNSIRQTTLRRDGRVV